MSIPPTNNRVFYACYAAGIAKFTAPSTYVTIRGMQAAGLSGRIGTQYIHEIGNLPTYSSFEELPEIEVSAEKVLDGYSPIFLLATEDAPTADLAGRSNQRCHLALSVHRDNQARATTNQVAQAVISGAYPASVGYDIMVNGAARESVSFVANNVTWTTGSYVFTGHNSTHGVSSLVPAATEGVNRRQHLNMSECLFPISIPGISSSGTNDPTTIDNNVQFAVSMESIKVNASFGRTPAMELGRKGPYFRFMEFPVDVSTTIEFMDKRGSMVNIAENGTLANGDNTIEETIYIKMEEGLELDLGDKNRLVSFNETGGAAGGRGDNRKLSFTYQNQNDLTVQHSADPTVALRP